jgi:hypothetical protein
MCVKVEVVDASLDYNILLGRSWIYANDPTTNDQFGQVKLAFDVVLGIMGLPNVC